MKAHLFKLLNGSDELEVADKEEQKAEVEAQQNEIAAQKVEVAEQQQKKKKQLKEAFNKAEKANILRELQKGTDVKEVLKILHLPKSKQSAVYRLKARWEKELTKQKYDKKVDDQLKAPKGTFTAKVEDVEAVKPPHEEKPLELQQPQAPPQLVTPLECGIFLEAPNTILTAIGARLKKPEFALNDSEKEIGSQVLANLMNKYPSAVNESMPVVNFLAWAGMITVSRILLYLEAKDEREEKEAKEKFDKKARELKEE